MDIWEAMQAAASVGFMLCLVPQFIKTWRTRRVDDMSWGFLVLVIVSSALGVPYALHSGQWFLAASWLVNLGVWGFVLYCKWRPASVIAAE